MHLRIPFHGTHYQAANKTIIPKRETMPRPVQSCFYSSLYTFSVRFQGHPQSVARFCKHSLCTSNFNLSKKKINLEIIL